LGLIRNRGGRRGFFYFHIRFLSVSTLIHNTTCPYLQSVLGLRPLRGCCFAENQKCGRCERQPGFAPFRV
jgi:hypothetical protein